MDVDMPEFKQDQAEYTHSKLNSGVRKLRFLELYAGMGGLSRAVQEIAGDLVEVLEPQDLYHEWDILSEEGFNKAKQWVEEADWTHAAFPCKSFSRARRSDMHGTVEVIRSDERPEGWGHWLAEEGNEVLKRTVALGFRAHGRGKFFTMENPADSFAWLMKVVLQLQRLMGADILTLDQCPYGAETVKPTGIFAGAPWMCKVQLRCKDVRPHRHRQGGLAGHVWDPVDDIWVWRTSKAAEYPAGLCWAWASALREWVLSHDGQWWLAERTLIREADKVNKLVSLSQVWTASGAQNGSASAAGKSEETAAQQRERENSEVVGGLRDPRRAVARNAQLQTVGGRIRSCFEDLLEEEVLHKFENANDEIPFAEELIWEAQRRLALEFQAELLQNGYQSGLLRSMLEQAHDPDAKTLPTWLEDGFGINREIEYTGIFPQTDTLSAAAKASQAFAVMDDWAGDARNYSSFEEAGEKAQRELDRMVEHGWAVRHESWAEVVAELGEANLTKMACIVKMKRVGRKCG